MRLLLKLDSEHEAGRLWAEFFLGDAACPKNVEDATRIATIDAGSKRRICLDNGPSSGVKDANIDDIGGWTCRPHQPSNAVRELFRLADLVRGTRDRKFSAFAVERKGNDSPIKNMSSILSFESHRLADKHELIASNIVTAQELIRSAVHLRRKNLIIGGLDKERVVEAWEVSKALHGDLATEELVLQSLQPSMRRFQKDVPGLGGHYAAKEGLAIQHESISGGYVNSP